MNDHFFICLALDQLGYKTGWILRGDDLNGLTWLNENDAKPNVNELQTKIDELKKVYAAD